MKTSANICFYGAGSMAEAIIRGLLDRGIAAAEQISVINRSAERSAHWRNAYGIEATVDREQRNRLLGQADVIFLAMKPKDAVEALLDVRSDISPAALVVSVIAGLPMAAIEAVLAAAQPPAIVRTMPNTSCTIGLGATGISFSAAVSPAQRELTLAIFAAVGEASVVEEALLDIVTGVSGSGPAYVYYLMEAMIRGGVEGGLSEQAARALTAQTVLGAARMVQTTGETPEALRLKVTSPNGTTQAAIETLERYQFSDGVRRAVLRAAERAGELGAAIAAQQPPPRP